MDAEVPLHPTLLKPQNRRCHAPVFIIQKRLSQSQPGGTVVAWLFINDTNLHQAAGKGDLDTLRQLIDAGADLNAPDGEGETALHKAAKANQAKVVQHLLKLGADPLVSAMGPFGSTGTPIHTAAKFGRLDSLKALIEGGVDPNLSDPVGTPLHLALRARRSAAAELLREAGAGSVSLPPVDALIAAADPEEGRPVANTCQLCHRMTSGAEDSKKPAPPLWNIVGLQKASAEGFAYSEAMMALGGQWTFEDLNSLVADVPAYVPGTKMSDVAGIQGESPREALLRYLRDLADDPVPLPE